MVRSFTRGHPIEFVDGKWRYSDTGETMDDRERPCARCGRLPTKEGYDACLGYIEGVTSACCGHGISEIILMGE